MATLNPPASVTKPIRNQPHPIQWLSAAILQSTEYP